LFVFPDIFLSFLDQIFLPPSCEPVGVLGGIGLEVGHLSEIIKKLLQLYLKICQMILISVMIVSLFFSGHGGEFLDQIFLPSFCGLGEVEAE